LGSSVVCLTGEWVEVYKSDKAAEKEYQGKIILDGCAVEIAPEAKFGRKFCFELTSPHQNRTYIIVAENGTSLQEWMNAIRRAMLRIRREKSKMDAVQRKQPKNASLDDGDSRDRGESVERARGDSQTGGSVYPIVNKDSPSSPPTPTSTNSSSSSNNNNNSNSNGNGNGKAMVMVGIILIINLLITSTVATILQAVWPV